MEHIFVHHCLLGTYVSLVTLPSVHLRNSANPVLAATSANNIKSESLTMTGLKGDFSAVQKFSKYQCNFTNYCSKFKKGSLVMKELGFSSGSGLSLVLELGLEFRIGQGSGARVE